MKLAAIVSVILSSLLLVSMMPAFLTPASAEYPENSMWIEPSTINLETATASLGYKFNVTVYIKLGSNPTGVCGAWQFLMSYNSAYLNATRAGYTAGGKSEFFSNVSTVPLAPAFYASSVKIGESWGGTGPKRTVPGSGSLAWVEFEVIATPGKGESVNFNLDISSGISTGDTYALDGNGDSIPITAYDCSVTYTWSPPPVPTLTVNPLTRFYDRYSHWVNTTFTEDVVIAGLDAAWFLTNITCTLTFNSTFLEVLDVSFNPAWDVSTSYTIDNSAGTVDLVAETSQTLSGDVVVATLTFNITAQGTFPDVYVSALDFSNYRLCDHTVDITAQYGTNVSPGEITVEGYLAVHMPYLQVVPTDTVVGPEPVIGKEFTVAVDIKELHFAWKLIGVQFRMTYCDDLLQVVKVEEGPYLGNWAPYGTWFTSYVEPDYYGPHVLVGTMILPNDTGYWNPPYPGAETGETGENGTIAYITFKVLTQLVSWPPENLTCTFGLFDIEMIDSTGADVPFEPPVNGTYTCMGTPARGRFIDVYGGAVNRGYGSIPFPAPYGGQGPNQPMDMVAAQSQVTLFANVTYNYWPEQYKTVSFEIIDPHGTTWAKLSAQTDSNGVATITFRMPWVCENATYYFGVWTVIATSEVADVWINDTLQFHYDYLVHIWKVTTDTYYYAHGDTVTITIEYGTHAQQSIYPGVITATILDETGVPIGYTSTDVTLGGAVFCQYANGTVVLTIQIPKFARAGYAYVHVNIFDYDPSAGGSAWCPEYPAVEIYILPE